MIEPGAVFEVPERLARPPQRAFQDNPPIHESRWLLVVSSERDCQDASCENIQTVLLSSRTDLAGPYDVLVLHPDGGVSVDSIAQTDIFVTLDRRDISGPSGSRYRGTVMTDTLIRVRTLMRQRLDLH